MNKTALTIKEQADSIVDKFKGYAGGHGEYTDSDIGYWEKNETINATHIAIIHVEGILGELEELAQQLSHNPYSKETITQAWSNNNQILTELKSRL
jgi:hypothetical protein